jgi:hypothetical protein
MQFIRQGEYLAASMITGPKHNLLQVRVGAGEQGVPICEMLPPVGKCVHKPLDPEEIIARVLEGLVEANARMGTNHSITHIRYVENDTGPEVVYGHMCLKLLEHLEAGGAFVESVPQSGASENAL